MTTSDARWWPLPKASTRMIVTGATGGLGRAILTAARALDLEVVGIDLNAEERDDNRYRIIEADLGDESQIEEAIAAAAQHLGGVDAVIGAAGIVDTIHRAEHFPNAAFRRDIDINLTAQFSVARAAYPFLRQSQSPAIVYVSSQAGLDGLPGQVSYSATKAALVGLTATLAAEWAADGIRVNSVAPGLFDTPKVVAMPDSVRSRMTASTLLKRSGAVDEVVGPILFLLSPASSYITGRVLRIDGGAGLTATGFFR